MNDYRTDEGRVVAQLVDIVTGIRVLRAIGGERSFQGRFGVRSKRLQAMGNRAAVPQAFIERVTAVVPALLGITVLWVAVLAARDETMSAGDVVSVFGLSAFLLMPLQQISHGAMLYPAALTGCDRVARLLRVEALGDGSAPQAAVRGRLA